MTTTTQTTESLPPADRYIDQLPLNLALEVMLDNQGEAIAAIRAALPDITRSTEAAQHRLESSSTGRLIYVGAGTSARIGVQDGAELLPTFNWPQSRVDFVIAGGPDALLHPKEDSEDSKEEADRALLDLSISRDDVVIGLAASGTTTFTIQALTTAMAHGALTIGIANNPDTPILTACDHAITLATGAESLAGSTRLKAGTAQKICLNLISTMIMTGMGMVKNGLMIDMVPRNAKLRDRKERILQELQQGDSSV